ncbi:ion channel domain-containing protein [Ditylenchus destructor]|uniref:Ion channel domain-containing protein n=1 Tax=Ditylenchus destructor TaxID=166010 RepID=A0AAD4ML48_9BILA|nr:ion channel domain-containing protein [Ditylenchus destructor]
MSANLSLFTSTSSSYLPSTSIAHDQVGYGTVPPYSISTSSDMRFNTPCSRPTQRHSYSHNLDPTDHTQQSTYDEGDTEPLNSVLTVSNSLRNESLSVDQHENPALLEFRSPSQNTLNRSLSSPELLIVPCPSSYGYPSCSTTPSPMPNGDCCPSTLPLLVCPPTPNECLSSKRSSNRNLLFSSSESLCCPSSASSAAALTNTRGAQYNSRTTQQHRLQRPQVQLNGSLLSIGNAQLLESANKLGQMMEHYAHQRRPSVGSAHSESTRARNLVLLQNVGKTLQRTHSHLKRTRLLHCFYLFALPVYTLFGALIFQALDGSHDDYMMKLYQIRCQEERERRLESIRQSCMQNTTYCFDLMSEFLAEVETCYRRWHETNKTMTHPMSDFTNAVIYAFSVYTTIGYGTISASTVSARIATVMYGAFGIPLFFAFIKEEGNQCRILFIWLYSWVKEWLRKHTCRANKSQQAALLAKLPKKDDLTMPLNNGEGKFTDKENMTITIEKELARHTFIRKTTNNGLSSNNGTTVRTKSSHQKSTNEQRRVFLCGVLIFIVYLFSVSWLFAMMVDDWDYFTAFYFLFNSSKIILGFGDVFPSHARIILVNMFFIVMGVVLFSMCYFILQEEIRVKAFAASRKARMSIR